MDTCPNPLMAAAMEEMGPVCESTPLGAEKGDDKALSASASLDQHDKSAPLLHRSYVTG